MDKGVRDEIQRKNRERLTRTVTHPPDPDSLEANADDPLFLKSELVKEEEKSAAVLTKTDGSCFSASWRETAHPQQKDLDKAKGLVSKEQMQVKIQWSSEMPSKSMPLLVYAPIFRRFVLLLGL